MKKYIAALLSIVLVLPITPNAVAQTLTSKNQIQNSEISENENSQSQVEQEILGLQDEVAEGFEVLFSEVIVPNENGIWEVDLEAAARVVPEMTLEELQAAANFINYGPGAQVSARGAAEYGRCVAESFLPGFINYSDAVRIGERLQARDWSGAASVLTQAWASAAAGNALIYGASEGLRLFLKNNPAVFAARLAVYAGTCALTS